MTTVDGKIFSIP